MVVVNGYFGTPTSTAKDIYNKPIKSVKVLCHTSLGDQNDELGRFYLKGNEYEMNTEVHSAAEDTNNEECILCWLSQNSRFGSRFAVKGNIYDMGEAYWPHFTEYFECPLERERDNKLKQILNDR